MSINAQEAKDGWSRFKRGEAITAKQRNLIIQMVQKLAARVQYLEQSGYVREIWSNEPDVTEQDHDRTPVRSNPLFRNCCGCNALIAVDSKFCGFCGVQQ